jgi:aminoglycoside/choline kinase family phosphotransferase
MSDRDTLIQEFLSGTHWANWKRHPLAGDASARRYLRLSHKEQSAILMDADPELGQNTTPFAQIGHWLRDQGFSAPKTYLHDQMYGLMLIEDLGSIDFAVHLKSNPKDATKLYGAAADILADLDRAQAPENLITMTPDVGGEMLGITTQWYADGPSTDLPDIMATHLDQLCGPAEHIALRDFHAENLIWRENRSGPDRIGLLDYQDAFIAPRGYDLVSLLRDVRRTVDPTLATAMTNRFIEKTQAGPDATAAFACLAVQRNLRILGVFARLALRDDKPRYVKMIPHIWTIITKDLTHPALSDLQKCVQAALPTPEKSQIRVLL